jgi:hypothetical protein
VSTRSRDRGSLSLAAINKEADSLASSAVQNADRCTLGSRNNL